MLKWIATYKDGSKVETDYSQNYSTQERFRQIDKSQLKKFTWVVRDIDFSLDCVTGEFYIDGESIKPDYAVENCGGGLVAFIRGYKDLGVGSKNFGEGIESVNLGYSTPDGQILLWVDYQTLKWKIHKTKVE